MTELKLFTRQFIVYCDRVGLQTFQAGKLGSQEVFGRLGANKWRRVTAKTLLGAIFRAVSGGFEFTGRNTLGAVSFHSGGDVLCSFTEEELSPPRGNVKTIPIIESASPAPV